MPPYPWWVKLSDFGISKRVEENATNASWTKAGTDGYMAPELLGLWRSPSHSNTQAGSQSDTAVWNIQEIQAAVRMANSRTSLEDIARACRKTEAEVRAKLRDMNVNIPPTALEKQKARTRFRPDPQTADIWALGVVAHQMLTAQICFQSLGDLVSYCSSPSEFPSDMLRKIRVSDQGIGFILKTMEVDPTNRLTAGQALRHAWVDRFSIDSDENASSGNSRWV